MSALVFSGYYCEHRKQGEAGNNFLLQIKGLLQKKKIIIKWRKEKNAHTLEEMNRTLSDVEGHIMSSRW